MYISEAEQIVEPRSEMILRAKKRKKLSIYLYIALILFALLVFLGINNYRLLQSYRELTNQLSTAYKTIDGFTDKNISLSSINSKLDEKNTLLIKEIKDLRQNYEKTSRGSEDIEKQLIEIKKQLLELKTKNMELVEDNIALQNSLKTAASFGVKPQNYVMPKKLNERSSIDRGKYIGKFIGTAYTPSKEECGNNRGITKSGNPIVPGVTIAVDTKYWPFGTVFYIKGLGYAIAMDSGSGVKGKYRFDFSVLSKDFAKALGRKKWEVYLVKMGKGIVSGVEL